MIYEYDVDQLQKHIDEELELADSFDDFFVTTRLADQFSLTHVSGQKASAGVFVKDRVLGVTLIELVSSGGSNYLNTPAKIEHALSSLESFKARLAEKMVEKAAEGIYMGDLHAGNIMYDGQRWYLVDASRLMSKAALGFYLNDSTGESDGMFDMLKNIQAVQADIDAPFFVRLIDNQLSDFYQELKLIYRDALQDAS